MEPSIEKETPAKDPLKEVKDPLKEPNELVPHPPVYIEQPPMVVQSTDLVRRSKPKAPLKFKAIAFLIGMAYAVIFFFPINHLVNWQLGPTAGLACTVGYLAGVFSVIWLIRKVETITGITLGQLKDKKKKKDEEEGEDPEAPAEEPAPAPVPERLVVANLLLLLSDS